MTQTMYHGRFLNKSGSPEWAHLDNKTALLMWSIDRTRYMGQFDDLSVPESHGWRSFPIDHFDQVRLMSVPVSGELWRHYRGGIYLVICVSRDEETLEDRVVYRSIAEPVVYWDRKLSVWLTVMPDGEPRFRCVGKL